MLEKLYLKKIVELIIYNQVFIFSYTFSLKQFKLTYLSKNDVLHELIFQLFQNRIQI